MAARIFLRAVLPLGMPWILAGTGLALMETLADFGTVAAFRSGVRGHTRTRGPARDRGVLWPARRKRPGSKGEKTESCKLSWISNQRKDSQLKYMTDHLRKYTADASCRFLLSVGCHVLETHSDDPTIRLLLPSCTTK